jgi:hypothetical protein
VLMLRQMLARVEGTDPEEVSIGPTNSDGVLTRFGPSYPARTVPWSFSPRNRK